MSRFYIIKRLHLLLQLRPMETVPLIKRVFASDDSKQKQETKPKKSIDRGSTRGKTTIFK